MPSSAAEILAGSSEVYCAPWLASTVPTVTSEVPVARPSSCRTARGSACPLKATSAVASAAATATVSAAATITMR